MKLFNRGRDHKIVIVDEAQGLSPELLAKFRVEPVDLLSDSQKRLLYTFVVEAEQARRDSEAQAEVLTLG